MDEDATDVGLAPSNRRAARAEADTDPWEDTDRDVEAQAPLATTPLMFEDTGVVIVDPVPPPPRDFIITFRPPTGLPPRPSTDFAECSKIDFCDEQPSEPTESCREPSARASTLTEYPPEPREPAVRAPQIRDRALRHAAVYRVVVRPDTKS